MMKQYQAIKQNYRDAILLFRLGDFYEMFFEDAIDASTLLDLTLTSRNKNQKDSVPLCGIPYHASQNYINRLLANGRKVAICEQMEDPKMAKGIVKREVTQVLSPGLILDPDCLEKGNSNYLVSIVYQNDKWGLAMADISTGDFRLTEIYSEQALDDEIKKLECREILLNAQDQKTPWVLHFTKENPSLRVNLLPHLSFDPDFASQIYQRYYQINPQELGLSHFPVAFCAGGALLSYLNETKILKPDILSKPKGYHCFEFMVLDDNTKKNLELVKTIGEGKTQGSLLWLLNQTQTPMGARLIKEWLLYPLMDVGLINGRLEAIQELVAHPELLSHLRELLYLVSDLERIQNRVLALSAHARDLKALAESLKIIPAIRDSLAPCRGNFFKDIFQSLDPLEDLQKKIFDTLVETPPLSLKEGGLIRQGVLPDLDELKNIEANGKSVISSMEVTERQRTGIFSLKIRYNKVFGYYIEITHTHKDKIPSNYIRKQTLTSAERYITPELKEYEDKVLGSSERIKELEYEIFLRLREEISSYSRSIKQTASHLAKLDVLCSLGFVAHENRYVRPTIKEEGELKIIQGRHPLVEELHQDETFVPNDVILSSSEQSESPIMMIITGPNMAGKSTLMRQAALVTIMAQMGGFVPAVEASMGLVDRIFTRIGASDHLQKGQSTFMVEMLETAQILSQATQKSLILLDEIGRGTSTFDGLSIAWAVAETIHDKIGAKTLFATHYHELTDLADEKKGICNYHMAVKEYQGEVRFLRELKKGGTNRSYGVYVAKMAGLPSQTILRAQEILKLLEEKDFQFKSQATHNNHQPSLFEPQQNKEWEDEIKVLDLNGITPLEALNFLAKLKGKIK